jgi:hypothetical protein
MLLATKFYPANEYFLNPGIQGIMVAAANKLFGYKCGKHRLFTLFVLTFKNIDRVHK